MTLKCHHLSPMSPITPFFPSAQILHAQTHMYRTVRVFFSRTEKTVKTVTLVTLVTIGDSDVFCYEFQKGLAMISKDAVRKLVEELDGHSIFHPRALIELGLPLEAADDLTEEHKSSNAVGGQLIANDKRVESIFGIYGIDALRSIAKAVNADTSSVTASGRGTRAEQYKDAILSAI